MKPMNNKERCQLRQKAHKLKPVVMIGSQGLTENVLFEIDRALFDHELIKIKIASQDRVTRHETTEKICSHCQATLIQTIGHIIVIYRQGVNNAIEKSS